jgi:hypothetical protein
LSDLDKAVGNIVKKFEGEELEKDIPEDYTSDHEYITPFGEYNRADQHDQLDRNEVNDPHGYKLRGLVTDPRILDNAYFREALKRSIRMTLQQWIDFKTGDESSEAKF